MKRDSIMTPGLSPVFLLLLAGVLAGLLSGCDNDDPAGPQVIPLPTTPDELAAALVTTMVDMDSETGIGLLADDFAFYQDIPFSSMGTWEYADEVAYLANLFRGEAFVNARTHLVQPITSVTMTLDGSAGDWAESDDPRFPDTMMRSFDVVFDLAQSGMVRQVRNSMTLFVVAVENGLADDTWKLCGQVELPSDKVAEDISWGDLRRLFQQLVISASQDEAMEAFVLEMNDMNTDNCLNSLTMGFRFYQDIPGSQLGDWERLDEVIYLYHLFGGEVFTNEHGHTVQPANNITLALDGSAGPWVVSDDQRFPGPEIWKRTYSTVFDVWQPGLVLQVRADQTFFVERKEIQQDGETVSHYQICGQIELPTAKATEETSWGDIRDLYR